MHFSICLHENFQNFDLMLVSVILIWAIKWASKNIGSNWKMQKLFSEARWFKNTIYFHFYQSVFWILTGQLQRIFNFNTTKITLVSFTSIFCQIMSQIRHTCLYRGIRFVAITQPFWGQFRNNFAWNIRRLLSIDWSGEFRSQSHYAKFLILIFWWVRAAKGPSKGPMP